MFTILRKRPAVIESEQFRTEQNHGTSEIAVADAAATYSLDAIAWDTQHLNEQNNYRYDNEKNYH